MLIRESQEEQPPQLTLGNIPQRVSSVKRPNQTLFLTCLCYGNSERTRTDAGRREGAASRLFERQLKGTLGFGCSFRFASIGAYRLGSAARMCVRSSARAHEASPGASFDRGSSIQNRLPESAADSTPIRPPIRSTPLRTIARPIPVPGYASTPCNLSKTRKMRE